MVACENNLYIQGKRETIKYFISILDKSPTLFEAFIPLSGTYIESYGTSSDIYIENIVFDLSENDVINLIFYTHNTPCIEFCKRLAGKFGVNTQLTYFKSTKSDLGFSGRFEIYLNQIVKDERLSYWQGMYNYNYDLFWENIDKIKSEATFVSFMELKLSDLDYQQLKYKFDEFNLLKQFKKL